MLGRPSLPIHVPAKFEGDRNGSCRDIDLDVRRGRGVVASRHHPVITRYKRGTPRTVNTPCAWGLILTGERLPLPTHLPAHFEGDRIGGF